MSYLTNAWYMAAWSSELTDALLSRRLLDQRIVFFRDEEGCAAALADRCPHRFAPLRLGKCVDGGVECGYHGLRFGRDGSCKYNPNSEGHVPPGAKVRAYPVEERHQILWIWMGDADRADPADIPDLSIVPEAAGAYHNLGNYLHVKANYLLELDNLMDLSHVNYLHLGTLGNESMRGHQVKVSDDDGAVRADLWMPNTVAPGYSPLAGQPCDQWTNIIWRAPGVMILEFGLVEPGADPLQLRENVALHIVTPETSRTTHYFFGTCGVYDEATKWQAEAMREAQTAAFLNEDNPMIEAIDEEMDGADLWSLRPAILAGDKAAVRVRRRMEQLIRAECAPEVGSEESAVKG